MDDTLVYNIEDPQIFYKEYDTSKNKSSPILNKYERTQVIYERCNLIINGAKPFIKNPEKSFRNYVFAEHNWHDYEAHQRMIRNDSFLYIVLYML